MLHYCAEWKFTHSPVEYQNLNNVPPGRTKTGTDEEGKAMGRWMEWILPDWASRARSDPTHSHGRRFTRRYRKKREIVKSVWIGSGLVMLAFPALPLIAALSLLTTFVSFLILDETV